MFAREPLRMSPIMTDKTATETRNMLIPSLLQSYCYRIIFDKPEKSVTLGQIVVLYDDEECLGGGIIKEIIK